MAQQDWKSRLGVVYSTNPDFQYQTEPDAPEADTLPPQKQRLVVRIDRRRRAGKQERRRDRCQNSFVHK